MNSTCFFYNYFPYYCILVVGLFEKQYIKFSVCIIMIDLVYV